MYFHSAPSATHLGAPPAPPSVLLRHFSCGAAQLASVRALVGPAVTADQLRAAVHGALSEAVAWSTQAMFALRRAAREKGDTARIFEDTFGTSFKFIPSWRPAGKTWDRGDVVRARLAFVTKLLAGGSIHFFCWGSPAFCPECTDDPSTYYACSSWGKKFVICLGEEFWKDWKAGRTDSLAATLIHESLHIYFGTLIAHGEKGRYGDASCYQRFVLRMAGRALPDRFQTRCAPPRPVGDFPPPPPGIRYASGTGKKGRAMYLSSSADPALGLADAHRVSAGHWGQAPAPTTIAKVSARKSPARRSRRGWKRTSVQVSFTNYRAVPLEYYYVTAYIIDAASKERVLLGSAMSLGSSMTGDTGVITYPDEILPTEGTLVLRVIPEYRTIAGHTSTRGEFVGDVIAGAIPWKRTRRVNMFSANQETADVAVKASNLEEAETKLRDKGKIGLVIGPLEAGGESGSERTGTKSASVEIEYKAKVALPSLRITLIQ